MQKYYFALEYLSKQLFFLL